MAKVKTYLLPKATAEGSCLKTFMIIYLDPECQLRQESSISGWHTNTVCKCNHPESALHPRMNMWSGKLVPSARSIPLAFREERRQAIILLATLGSVTFLWISIFINDGKLARNDSGNTSCSSWKLSIIFWKEFEKHTFNYYPDFNFHSFLLPEAALLAKYTSTSTCFSTRPLRDTSRLTCWIALCTLDKKADYRSFIDCERRNASLLV